MLHFAKATHTGLVRSHNEDCVDFVVQDDGSWLMVLSDGMGGHSAGEVASSIATETLCAAAREGASNAAAYKKAIQQANAAIRQRAETDVRTRGMGTTLVAAFGTQPDDAVVANIGDSRAYHFCAQAGTLRRVTRDHSLVEEMMLSGHLTAEQARTYPFRNVITRALGASTDVVPDFFEVELQPGDALLLCSDGLTNEVSEPEICAVLTQFASNPEAACENLIARALESGARDNVSVCLAFYSDEEGGDAT